jgi:hypothetical protein
VKGAHQQINEFYPEPVEGQQFNPPAFQILTPKNSKEQKKIENFL